ncbi:roadblock/LC7 domain-containing protein [Micromonospora purpureochromogenes]|uniref:roadblock/LC7 domain-containing protein n=1 Tax=Micromonospora purpureochromogenes TaxID=47872 RepID=UPI00362900F7
MHVDTVMDAELRRLRRRRPEVAGTVLGGRDGMLIASDLPTTDATHLAALAAVSFGVGHQVAHTVRGGGFRESVVHTATGSVVTYPAGRHALLTLVTGAGADLEALHAEARAVAERAGSAFDSQRVAVGATPVPQVHGALAVRTPLPALARRRPGSAWRRPPL